MVETNRKMYERNDIEIIVDNDGILWSNEKNIEEGLKIIKICEKLQQNIVQIIENIDSN